jgi:hypothetical protein
MAPCANLKEIEHISGSLSNPLPVKTFNSLNALIEPDVVKKQPQ